MPADWSDAPAANAAHKMPISVRRAYCRPVLVDENDVSELMCALAGSIVDAITRSDIWTKLQQWDIAPFGTRKNCSRYGACIARTFQKDEAGRKNIPYQVLGTWTYCICIHFICMFAKEMGLGSLTHMDTISNPKHLAEHTGDLWECIAGEAFIDRPGCEEGSDWWYANWQLSSVADNEACRLLVITSFIQRLQTTSMRIDKLEDVGRTYKDLRATIDVLTKRAEELTSTTRKRSVEGEMRMQTRNDTRKAQWLEKKGKGKTGGKGKGDGKDAKGSGGKDAGSWPPRRRA